MKQMFHMLFLGWDIPMMRQLRHRLKNDGTSYCKWRRKHAFESIQWMHGKWPFCTPDSSWAKLHPWGRSSWFLGRPAGMAAGLCGFNWHNGKLAETPDLQTHSFGSLSPLWQIQQRSEQCNQQVSKYLIGVFNLSKKIWWNDHPALKKKMKTWNHGPHSFGSLYLSISGG